MLTIQLYGLAEHPKTQMLKANLLDALVELPLAFSFVQISTIDAFLEQQLPEVPCLMVNDLLIPSQCTQSIETLSETLQKLADQQTEEQLSPPLLSSAKEAPPPSPNSTDTPKTVKRRKRKTASVEAQPQAASAPKPKKGTTPSNNSSNNKPSLPL
jgi:hypothetical protein